MSNDTIDQTEIRKAARGHLLGVVANRKARSVVIDVDGQQIEVRNPTLSARMSIGELARRNGETVAERYESAVTIMCCFLPGTDTRVFEPADMDVLMTTETGSFVDTVSQVVGKMIKETTENAEAASKNGP